MRGVDVRIDTDRLILRAVEPDDLPELLDVYLSNREYLMLTEGAADGVGTYDLNRLQRDWHLAAITPGRVMLGIYDRETGKAVGVADYLVENPSDRTPWLGLLMIHRDWQRKGLGKEAFCGLTGHFIRIGWTRVRIGVLRANQGVLPFWRGLGFRMVGSRGRRTPQGQDEVLVFELSLGPGGQTS